jgi:hypothetical protein
MGFWWYTINVKLNLLVIIDFLSDKLVKTMVFNTYH